MRTCGSSGLYGTMSMSSGTASSSAISSATRAMSSPARYRSIAFAASFPCATHSITLLALEEVEVRHLADGGDRRVAFDHEVRAFDWDGAPPSGSVRLAEGHA